MRRHRRAAALSVSVLFHAEPHKPARLAESRRCRSVAAMRETADSIAVAAACNTSGRCAGSPATAAPAVAIKRHRHAGTRQHGAEIATNRTGADRSDIRPFSRSGISRSARPHGPGEVLTAIACYKTRNRRSTHGRQHQSQSVHHAAGDRRHLRRRHLDALDRDRGRHGDPGARRQRLRRRGRHRLHPSGGRAASERPRRRRAGAALRRAQGQAGADLRPGPGAGRRDHRALQERRPRHGARHRPARRLRARHVRHLDDAAARLRHDEARRRADARDFLRAERPSAGRARQRHHHDGREAVPRSLADLGRDLSAGRQARRDRHAVHQPDDRRDLHARAEGGRERRRRPRRADREGAESLVAGLRRRGDRQVLPHPGGDGHQRLAAQGRADRRGHGELAGARSKRR